MAKRAVWDHNRCLFSKLEPYQGVATTGRACMGQNGTTKIRVNYASAAV